MPHTRYVPSFTFTAERLEELKGIVPEAFADGKVNWEALKEALGEHLEFDEPQAEHFGLFWPGKREARRLTASPSRGALLPVQGEGVNEKTTGNFFIEGDNLEVLKLLQKSYAGSVKMIYIDPPFNTGNDSVYRDDFRDPINVYLKWAGHLGANGKLLTTNTRADGRFHSNWLSMMYPRLRLARTLLREDGLIFVSIDDNEAGNLRALLGEVFGDEGFVAQLVWKSRQSEDTRAKTGVSVDHEYIMCFRRSDVAALRGTDKDLSKFSNPDSDPRGPWRSADLTGLATRDRRPNLHYDLIDPRTKINYGCPPKGWRFEPATMAAKIADGRVLFPADPSGRPRHKLFLNEMRSHYKNMSSIILEPTTTDGTREINGLLGDGIVDFPKPSALIEMLIRQSCEDDDIILDFFAGSCPTAHAVLRLNHEDGGQRKFIMVQLPEPMKRGNYKNIAEVGKERIRRVIKNLKREAKPDENLGFRVLKLGQSHFRVWQDYTGGDPEQLQALFDRAQDPLQKGWTPEGLLVEVMLLEGFPLDATVEDLLASKSNSIQVVESARCNHRLLICFDKRIEDGTVDGLTLKYQDVFVCFDTALTDQAKQRLADRCTLKTI